MSDGPDPDESGPVPTQRIGFATQAVLKGGIAARFSLFKTGTQNFTLEGDPPYAVGEQYLLFIEPRGDGTYLPVAPDGRVRITPTATVAPLIEGAVAAEIGGRSVVDFTRLIADLVRRRGARAASSLPVATSAARRARLWTASGRWIHHHTLRATELLLHVEYARGRVSSSIRVRPDRRVIVPALVGLTESRAECLLRRRGLRWRFPGDSRVRSSPVAPCRSTTQVTPDPKVLEQKPRPATRVGKGSIVTIENGCTRRRLTGEPPCA